MKIRLYGTLFIGLSILILAACSETEKPSYSSSDLYIFGDSLSDVGNARLATAGLFPDKNYHEGRFSNGPNYADQLAEKLNTPLIPSRSFGSNYAFGGTRSLEMNAQVFNYKENAAGIAKEGATYIVWSGGNDLIQTLQSDDPSGDIEEAVGHIENAIRKLATMGASNILVPNQPNMARLPRFIELENISPGLMSGAQTLTVGFNAALKTMLDNLAAEETPIVTIYFDVFTLFEAVISDYESYNLTNFDDRCYVRDYSSLELTGNEEICSDSDTYLFWDDIHPSTTGHGIIADAFYSALTEG